MISEMIYNAMLEYNQLAALKIGERKFTYKELNNSALTIASMMLHEEINGKNIGIVGQRNFSAYAGILGTIYSGNTYVPINKKYPEQKIKDIINDADIEVLISSGKDWNQLNSIFNSVSTLKIVFIPEGDIDKSNKKIKTVAEFEKRNIITRPVSVNADHNLYIMFTSGSTGKPKGVQVMHSNVASLIKSLVPIYEIEPGYNSSQSFDLSFDPSICDIFLTWYKGGTLCVLDEGELYCPSDYILREKIHFWHSVPTLANNIGRLGYLKPGVFSNLKYSIFAGEPLSVKLASQWARSSPNSRVENRYGPTELTVDVTQHIFVEDDQYKKYNNGIVPIGKAFTNQKLKIIDENDKIISEKYEKGELIVCGSQVTKGYLNDNEKTNQSFVRYNWDKGNDLWYKTGDLVFLNEDNNFEIIGRMDKQIKLGGRRFEIGEIEYILKEHGGLDEIVIVPKKDMAGAVEYIVGVTEKKLSEDEINIIQKKCRKHLESIFFPKEFRYIGEIPLTVSGKIDRVFLENIIS